MANYDLGQLVFKITGDNSQLKKTMEDSKKSASGFASALKSIGAVIASVGLVGFFTKASKAASDASEETSKFNVVFSKIQPLAEEVAQSLAASYGLAITESKSLLSATGNLLQGFGMTQEASLKTADVIQRLAGDLVSLTNYSGGVKGASEALTKALMGETEQAKSLGLALGDEQLAVFGAQMGLNTEKMGVQEKAMLRVKLAIQQSKNAIGDYAGTSDSFANTMRRFGNLIDEGFVKIGNELNPSILKTAKAFAIGAESGSLFSDVMGIVVKGVAKAIQGFGWLIVAAERYYNVQQRSTVESLRSIKLNEANEIVKKSAATGQLSKAVADAAIKQGKYADAIIALEKSQDSEAKKSGAALRSKFKELDAVSKKSSELENVNQRLIDATEDLTKTDNKDVDNKKAREKATADLLKRTKEMEIEVAKGNKGSTNVSEAKKQAEIKAAYNATKEALQGMSSETILLARNVNQLNEKELSDLTDNLKTASPAAKSFAETFSKIDVERMLADVQNIPMEEFLAKWGSKAKDVVEALQGIKATGVSDEIRKAKDETKSWAEEWNKLDFNGKFDLVNQTVSTIGSGLTGVFQALIELNNAQTENALSNLDAQMQAELEAAGVAEETDLQKAQREYDLLSESEKANTENEKVKALKKAQIESEYAKKKAQAEYDGALRSWELQKAMAYVQMLQAPLNAYVSALATPIIGPFIAPGLAALAAITAGLQFAAVQESKPQRPKFAQGGIVPGDSFTGDQVTAQVNSGEMVLTAAQQAQLFKMANGAGGGVQTINVYLNDDIIYSGLYDATSNGTAMIHPNGVATR